MTSLCEYMHNAVASKLKDRRIRPPQLRRQIAGNLHNPYDLEDLSNLDLRLYIEDFCKQFGTDPPSEHLEKVAIFPTTDNLVLVQQYLNMNLSKL